MPEVEDAYARARQLCQQLGTPAQLQQALHGLKVFYVIKGDLPTAREISGQILQLAQETKNPLDLYTAHGTHAESLFYLGEQTLAKENLQHALTLFNPEMRIALSFMWIDPQVLTLTYSAWVSWYLGYPDQALTKSLEAVALAEDLSHPVSLALAHCNAAFTIIHLRDIPSYLEHANAAIALSTEHGLPTWLALGTIYRGYALVQQGIYDQGLALIKEGSAIWQTTGAGLFQPFILSHLAEGHAQIGQVKEGLDLLKEALSAVEKYEERFFEPELHRVKGCLLLQQADSNVAEAEASFHSGFTSSGCLFVL